MTKPRPHPHFGTEGGGEDKEIGGKEKKTPTQGGRDASDQDEDSNKPSGDPRRKTPKGKKIRPNPDTNTSGVETIQQGNWVLPTIALPSNFLLQDLVRLITQKQVKLFDGEKFHFLSFDINNLHISAKKKAPQAVDVLSRIKQEILPKHGKYVAYYFATKQLEFYKINNPADDKNQWYIESKIKGKD